MKHSIELRAALLAAAIVFALTTSGLAQEVVPEAGWRLHVHSKPLVMQGRLVIPASNTVNAADTGNAAHTNVRFIVPTNVSPTELPPYPGYAYETPQSLACHYGIVTQATGCNPNTTTATPTGGSQTIAIVDAYDDPEAAADLAYFSAVFGLYFNPALFQVIYANGTEPPFDYTGGWEMEESLDIEYAHAMAPHAKLYLVEAASNSFSDLLTAVQVATNLVTCGKTTTCTGGTGKGEVSMSWGGSEFSGETAYDTYFTTPNVVYFAASGDSPGTIYPCVSPNVVCVGGTTLARNASTGSAIGEITWSDAGGGLSEYEPIPSYQSAVSSIVGKVRGVPDISADANPDTGLWVYDTFPQDYEYYYSWWIVGGTSASAPVVTGIVNAAGSFVASSSAELTTIYANRANTSDFTDITYGWCGFYSGTKSAAGYDLCTGVGRPNTLAGK